MTVDETIEQAIATYPSLFQNRTDVLHHLFIVLGCGYEWIDGELVDVCNDSDTEDRIPREAARILAKHRQPLSYLYPWSDLCNLATMPENAKQEWKDAAEEIKKELPEDFEHMT